MALAGPHRARQAHRHYRRAGEWQIHACRAHRRCGQLGRDMAVRRGKCDAGIGGPHLPDGDTDVLDPRLRAAGADLDRVRALRIDTESVPTRAFDLGLELKQLENAIASGQDVQLVVVDVLHVASGRTGMREARALFDRLATFARRHNVAVVALAQAADADYLTRKPTRLSGFTLASARMAFAIEADPADEDRRLLLQMKDELGPDPGTLAFRITSQATAPGQSAGTVTFEPHRPGLSPHEFTARQSRSFNSAKAEAIAFLRDLFGTEKRLWVRDIEA